MPQKKKKTKQGTTCIKEIPWGLYQRLHTSKSADIPSKVKQQICRPLTAADIEQHNFQSQDDALVALLRCSGWINSAMDQKGNKDALLRSKIVLLMGRAWAYLAALLLLQRVEEEANPPSKATVQGAMDQISAASSLASFTNQMLALATPDLEPWAFAWIAHATIGGVTRSNPGMAVAWLDRADVELLLAELEAFGNGESASKIRPEKRHGPWDLVPEPWEDDGSGDHLGWKVSIPIIMEQTDDDDMEKSFLADYWWGQAPEVAAEIAIAKLARPQQQLARYESLADRTIRTQMWEREGRLEREIRRRGAAAVASLNSTADIQDPKDILPNYTGQGDWPNILDNLRRIFPGSPFEPTEGFVRSLRNQEEYQNGNPPIPYVWFVGTILGGLGGGPNRSLVTVKDTSGGTRYDDYILHSQLFVGPDPNELFIPPADVLYRILLRAMAGAGPEMRAHNGPPRRPTTVVLSYRMRQSYHELVDLLRRVNVNCELDQEEDLRNACSVNHTDFVTGHAVQDKTEQAPLTQSLVGQLVGIMGLVSRSDLNGRVGTVIKVSNQLKCGVDETVFWIGPLEQNQSTHSTSLSYTKWHANQGRWQVKIKKYLDSESTETIAVKPLNLCRFPQELDNPDDYVMYRDEIRGDNVPRAPTRGKPSGAILERLQGMERTHHGNVCAICQEKIDGSSATQSNDYPLFQGQGTKLPCGHCFHLDCILQWITPEKAECPCCRCAI